MQWRIVVDDLSGQEIAGFLDAHLTDMRSVSPPESKHALDLDGLRRPEVTFWTAWDGATLAGCGAIQELDEKHAEVKSMRTAPRYHRRGVASALLSHIVGVATERGYRRLSLETGSMPFFDAARALYLKYGFEYCEPFAGYREDPNSVFMTLHLPAS